jgi:hypothetical protein
LLAKSTAQSKVRRSPSNNIFKFDRPNCIPEEEKKNIIKDSTDYGDYSCVNTTGERPISTKERGAYADGRYKQGRRGKSSSLFCCFSIRV